MQQPPASQAPPNQAHDDHELGQAVFLSRFLTPLLLLTTLVFTFGTRAFSRFVWKLQNVGYESLWNDSADRQRLPPQSSRSLATLQDHTRPNSRHPHVDIAPEGGIIPVVVPLKKPRRAWIYGVHALVALSYLLDGVLICVCAVWQHRWEPSQVAAWSGLDGYSLSCFVAFVACALAMSLEERRAAAPGGWGKIYTRIFGLQAWLGELVIAILSIKLLTRRSSSTQAVLPSSTASLEAYDLLHLINLLARLLLITMLCMLHTTWFYHREFVRFSSLQASVEGSPEPAGGYGTFAPSTGSSGHVLGTKPELREPPKPVGVWKLLKRIQILFPFLWPHRSRALQSVVLLCFLLLLLGRGVNLLAPIMLGAVTEDLSEGCSAWFHLGAFVGLSFLQGNGGILAVVYRSLWIPVAQYADRSMSMMTFTHLLDLSLSYHTRRKTSEVLRILDRGSAINQFFQVVIFNLVPIILDIGLAVGYLALRFDALLASMLMLTMIIYSAASVGLTQWRAATRREMLDKDKYASGIQGDSILNWETIAWFNTKTFETNRYLDATLDYQRSEFLVTTSIYVTNLVQNATIVVALFIGCFTVAFQVSVGQKTVGDFVLFVTFTGQLFGPLIALGNLYRTIQQNLTDTDNLMKLLAEPQEIEDRPNAQTIIKAKGAIEFDHVGFSYDGKTSALEDISFSVPAGSSVALVGESGSGKSTILRLLFRFYDPTSGSIKLDGVDIRDLTQASYRSQIGTVPQDAGLFNDTIRYNIGYGAIGVKPDGPAMEDVVEAAKAAQIHDRIMSFADGYETRVGERGVRLSGGEKQRVAIARVMIRNPPLILLDEATSALDTTTEREIQEALHKLGQGRTTVAIAHRLSTIVNSDVILVIHKGKIAERGAHADLLAAKGIYSDLWAKQIRAESEAGSLIGSNRNLESALNKASLDDTADATSKPDGSNSVAPSR